MFLISKQFQNDCYQWVIKGLSVGYQRVISGLSEVYQKVISGLSEGYQRVISFLLFLTVSQCFSPILIISHLISLFLTFSHCFSPFLIVSHCFRDQKVQAHLAGLLYIIFFISTFTHWIHFQVVRYLIREGSKKLN